MNVELEMPVDSIFFICPMMLQSCFNPCISPLRTSFFRDSARVTGFLRASSQGAHCSRRAGYPQPLFGGDHKDYKGRTKMIFILTGDRKSCMFLCGERPPS
jgi:hypothetical protein